MDTDEPDIRETYESLAGVWANSFDVFWSPHEFTIDFTRLELRRDEPASRGIAVARVAMSPALVLQLRNELSAELEFYERWSIHQEIGGDEPG